MTTGKNSVSVPGTSSHIGVPAKRELDLDMIRGIAILLAMGWHFNQALTPYPILNVVLYPGRAFGWAGVDLFFVLSGFLVGRLILNEYQRSGNFSYRRFFIRRAFKIWPLLYTFVIAMCIAATSRIWTFAPQIALHVQNYFPPTLATHLWSLAVEEHFYLLFGSGFALLCARSRAARALPSILIVLIVVAPALRYLGLMNGATPTDLQWQTQYRIDALSAGVLLAWLSVFQPSTLSRILRYRVLWITVSISGYTFLAFFSKDSPVGSTVGYTISYMAGLGLFLSVYRSGLDRLLPRPSRLLASIGVYSYATYIWHVPIGRACEFLASRFLHQSTTAAIILSYIAALLICPAISLLIEMPALRLRDRLFPARSRAA